MIALVSKVGKIALKHREPLMSKANKISSFHLKQLIKKQIGKPRKDKVTEPYSKPTLSLKPTRLQTKLI
jgi:hypothetical protein